MAGEKLASRIKQAKPRPSDLSDLVYGIVTQTSPLVIRVENRMNVTSNFLILSRMVKDLPVTIKIDGKSGSALAFRNLQVGDGVTMLRVQQGKKFYVLERT